LAAGGALDGESQFETGLLRPADKFAEIAPRNREFGRQSSLLDVSHSEITLKIGHASTFAHSNQIHKKKVCYAQLARHAEKWHPATMTFRIKELRKARDWTIEQLAEISGYSRGYVSQLETGKRHPSMEALDALAHAFKVSVPDLYQDHDLGAHLQIMRGLSPEDQAAVVRHALSLSKQAAE
jgi:DNA-binding XRE family transcriptional regulator